MKTVFANQEGGLAIEGLIQVDQDRAFSTNHAADLDVRLDDVVEVFVVVVGAATAGSLGQQRTHKNDDAPASRLLNHGPQSIDDDRNAVFVLLVQRIDAFLQKQDLWLVGRQHARKIGDAAFNVLSAGPFVDDGNRLRWVPRGQELLELRRICGG